MSQKSELVPKRRFKEFENAGDWKLCKLEEVVNITMGQSPSSDFYTDNPNDYILVQGNADMKNGKVVPRVWTTQVTKIAYVGDLILSVRAPVGDIGKTDYDVVIGRGVASISGNEFIFQLFKKLKINNFWSKLSSGSTFESINSNVIKEISIYSPTEQEQKQIGKILKTLDDTITLHQRKLDKLNNIKQSYLYQMFPQNGEKVPSLRFAGFNGDWKQHKLGEISDSYSGGTPSVSKQSFYGGNIPFIRSSEINSNGTELYLTDEGINRSSARLVNKGDILYALYGATSGEVGISQITGAINQAILAIKPKKDYDSFFIMLWLRRQKSSIISKYLQGGQGNLSGAIVKDLTLLAPIDYKEQQKIGQFFKQLDETIEVQEQELEKLKNLKEAYLNEMFV